MKTNIKQALQILWNRIKHAPDSHAHDIAVAVCGTTMGLLFATYVSVYQAAKFEKKPELTPAAVFEEVVLREAPPVPELSEDITKPLPEPNIDVTPKPVIVVPAKKVPAVQKPKTETVTRKPVADLISRASSSSSSASSEAPHAAAPENSSSASSDTSVPAEGFPAFDHTSFPVGRTPNWGAMRTASEWERPYSQMTDSDFVAIPRYDMSVLTVPMDTLTKPLRDENIPAITAKLFYSTRFFGRYDLDAGEFTGTHAAVDLKLARGTPIGAIAGGKVSYVATSEMFGLHVVIEHRMKNGDTYYSIYGHFDRATVNAGDTIVPGQTVGFVGMTGNTTAPHLHLQIDRGEPGEEHHIPYLPGSPPGSDEGLRHSVSPVAFIARYRSGE